MEEDRRYYPRQKVVRRVDYADTKGRAGLGMIKDLSGEGMLVAYVSGLTVGETLVVSFTLPGSSPFKLRVRVMRTTPTEAGLKFERLSRRGSDRYPETLEMYCATLCKIRLGHV